MSKTFALDYIDVAERIVGFRTKYPDGSLQQVAIDFREVAGGWWVVYTAAAYRTPEDPRPGHGTAWEPVPGKTNFTRDSELQNAETAAWGRAIVAVLAADTKRGIASAEEVRNRQAERDQGDPPPVSQPVAKAPTKAQNAAYVALDERIDAVTTVAELTSVWDAIVAAHATKAITDEQGNRLRAVLQSRSQGLGSFDESSGKGVGVQG